MEIKIIASLLNQKKNIETVIQLALIIKIIKRNQNVFES